MKIVYSRTMATVNTMMQSFFWTNDPVDPIRAWNNYIGGPVPIADPSAIKWGEYNQIAKALVEAGVAEYVLNIGVEASRQFVPGANNGHCAGRVIDQGRAL